MKIKDTLPSLFLKLSNFEIATHMLISITKFKALLFALLLPAITCIGQAFKYTNRNTPFDMHDRAMLISGPKQFYHLWNQGRTGLSLAVYDKDLKYVNDRSLNVKERRLSFMPYKDFYYALAMDSGQTKVFKVGWDGEITNKTEDLAKTLSIKRVQNNYFYAGENIMFLIQAFDDAVKAKSQLCITALDSNLSRINETNLEIEYLNGTPQRLIIHPFQDQLLLLNKTIGEGSLALAISKIDVKNNRLTSKFFYTEGLRFVSHYIVSDNNTLILKNLVTESAESQPNNYNYFIKLDSSLKILHTNYSKDSDQNVTSLPLARIPVFTITLPGQRILNVDFIKNSKRGSSNKEEIRFLWMDSTLRIIKQINLSTAKGQYFPEFLVANGDRLHLYYKERISNKISTINTYEPGEDIKHDRVLLLNPQYKYLLKNAIADNSSFVMPFTHNYRIGLVKVNVQQ